MFRQTLANTSFAEHLIGFGSPFLCHAKRVRRLHLYKYGDIDMHGDSERFVVEPDVLALWAARPDIFPLLHKLKIEEEYLMRSMAHETLLPAFLTNRAVCQLSISFGSTEIVKSFERTQAALLGRCAGLEYIELDNQSHGCNPAFRESIAMLKRWTAWAGSIVTHAINVRHMHIDIPISYEDLHVLSTVPTLETLYVKRVFYVPSAPAHLPCGAFPALHSLTLHDSTNHAALMQNMLSFGDNSSLEDCTLRTRHGLAMEDICALLAAACQHKRLEHISIKSILDDNSVQLTVDDTTVLLRGLRHSGFMQTLTLDLKINGSLPLREDHILHVLNMYSRLHTWDWRWETKFWAPMSLESLMAALKGRPHIRALPVRIARGDLPSAHAQASFGTHSYNGSIHFTESAFSNKLCAVIGKLFPNVVEYLLDKDLED
jgi:hypothetical protein